MNLVPIATIKHRNDQGPLDGAKKRLPSWFKVKLQPGRHYQEMRRLVEAHGLHTICEEARCPNIWECWNHRTATFLLLGDICTRRCHYCSVETGKPGAVDTQEPDRVAKAVQALQLRHAVLTSVNRDDLEDGGASIFAETVYAIRHVIPTCKVEVLIPDFQGSEGALARMMEAAPDILNHNVETVPRLFPSVRPQGKYPRSLELLHRAKAYGGKTKSGLMVGMGETPEEIHGVLRDLRSVECDIVSIGQYLQPTKDHRAVDRYYTPQEFDEWKQVGLRLGFRHVESGPLVRSSYHAEQQVEGMAL
ncbi:lipoyl synthase [Candidatus Nitronereus thalassa]|uniref:Lipoyl synthase n=1 Tax=Candidatus Nitronereus thalassa TaxID=3020898 RepID=A0ABU3K6L0_9BACT|nr:lipoyl synthase [Candidatus Nitronereus thalassa]MDT7042074.1 lipoyl synthase [Candidatus Nitronereus thalassa]